MSVPSSRVAVFAGPSLPIGRRSRYGKLVDWRPPAHRGDLSGEMAGVTDVVLLDGVMLTGHPPSPAEVASLLVRGVRVWGAASIGALRAVELRWQGMRGHGWVYEQVLSGKVTHDDELVATVDPRTYDATGVFLINIRYAVRVSGYLTRCGAGPTRQLLDAVADIPVLERSPSAVSAQWATLGITPAWCERLLSSEYDVKRKDAIGLLERVLT